MIWTLIRLYWRPLAAAGVLLAVAAAVGWYGHSKYNAGYAKAQAETAVVVADGQALARAAEQRRWAAREEIINDAKTQAAAALAGADRASAAYERLRVEADRLRAAAGDTAAVGGGQSEPGSDPIGVLIDVLERMGGAGGAISQFADGLKVAGGTCERSYDSLP